MKKYKILSVLTSFIFIVTTSSISTCSALFFYQPEVPEDM